MWRRYQIVRASDRKTVLRGQTQWVCVDMKSGRPKRMPPEFQAYKPWPKQIGRAHVCTPVTNAQLVCRLLLENKKPSNKNWQSKHRHTTTYHTQLDHINV